MYSLITLYVPSLGNKQEPCIGISLPILNRSFTLAPKTHDYLGTCGKNLHTAIAPAFVSWI